MKLVNWAAIFGDAAQFTRDAIFGDTLCEKKV